jgi:hypothetical protein
MVNLDTVVSYTCSLGSHWTTSAVANGLHNTTSTLSGWPGYGVIIHTLARD